MHGGDIYRNRVKLDFSVNINPLGIPESVRDALERAAGECERYPDPVHEELTGAIGSMTGARREHILCGNGASELFCAIVHGVDPEGILIPAPSFSGYERAAGCGRAGIGFYDMKEENGFRLDEGILDRLTDGIGLLFLANPNNPVGNLLEPELLDAILRRCQKKGIVTVLDECFIEFTEGWEERSCLKRTAEFPNLIVVRAFTKIFAIPGVRLGYLVCGNEKLTGRIGRQLPEWNLSVFAQRAGAAAARERRYVGRSAKLVKEEREFLTRALEREGIRVFPAKANYLLLQTEKPLAKELLKRGILIRDCGDYRGLSEGYYRIAVKSRAENEELLEAVREIVKGGAAE